MHDRIVAMLEAADMADPRFPPTLLYSERWMLRLVLDWVERSPSPSLPFPFAGGASWYSEALLPTAFRPRREEHPPADPPTHADAVIGHFRVGSAGRGELDLTTDAEQLSVLTGTMSDDLLQGPANAPGYDRAARNLACMAEALTRAKRSPSQVPRLSLHVLAPESRIEANAFGNLATKRSIHGRVRERVQAYGGALDVWFENWFLPTLDATAVELRSWESVLDQVTEADGEAGADLRAFYERCLHHGSAGPAGEVASGDGG